ncbi:aromatic acid exporter family protein [Irregularibacter muris]|uniref:Aromatic acid exporter family protein n=1 Tax=Irregularibacter muris TaxID=1796619 RepID=A0AAE3L4E9_9FIRM|nr:aromatic acid exporter family protein [Irregularibacter muris]MCR1899973.1 aromatic acid exporter family protein [Irregularibacter muris]
MKEHVIRGIKITSGMIVAILIAKALHMEFYTSVGTIVLVSMLDTKKQSLKIAGTRLLAAILSLALSCLLFSLFGFSITVFGIYLFIFTIMMSKFDTMIAIVLNVVLVLHVYSLKQISAAIILNEFLLMLLGITVALVFNAYNVNIEKEIKDYQKQLEKHLSSIFSNMSLCLINECNYERIEEQLRELKEIISAGKKRAYDYMNSYYLQHNNYYVEYFIMRSQQYYIIRSMQKLLLPEFLKKSEVMMLKYFTEEFFMNTRILDSYEIQLKALDAIKQHFYEAPLPTTHRQLKNRIALNQYLYSMEEITFIMIRFIEKFQSTELSQSSTLGSGYERKE